MNRLEATGLVGPALDLKPSGGGVRGRDGRVGFRCPRPPLGQPQGIPAKAQTVQTDQGRAQNGRREQRPAPRRQGPRQHRRPHGNAFRSSSK